MDKKLYQELQDCYSQQAEHFYHTRKKRRPEQRYLEEVLQKFVLASQQRKDQGVTA